MQKFIALGNLTRDIELKTYDGLAVAKTGLAVNESYKKNGETVENTTFLDLVAFGHTANFMAKRFMKGSKICIEGKIRNSSWTAEDGTKKYKTEILVESCYFAGDKPKSQQEVEKLEKQIKTKKGKKQQEEDEELTIEDIPF